MVKCWYPECELEAKFAGRGLFSGAVYFYCDTTKHKIGHAQLLTPELLAEAVARELAREEQETRNA